MPNGCRFTILGVPTQRFAECRRSCLKNNYMKHLICICWLLGNSLYGQGLEWRMHVGSQQQIVKDLHVPQADGYDRYVGLFAPGGAMGVELSHQIRRSSWQLSLGYTREAVRSRYDIVETATPASSFLVPPVTWLGDGWQLAIDYERPVAGRWSWRIGAGLGYAVFRPATSGTGLFDRARMPDHRLSSIICCFGPCNYPVIDVPLKSGTLNLQTRLTLEYAVAPRLSGGLSVRYDRGWTPLNFRSTNDSNQGAPPHVRRNTIGLSVQLGWILVD